MEDGNLLSGGVDTLNEIKENLLELNGYKAKHEELRSEEGRLEKSLQSAEKAAADEIMSTTKKRRQEIEETFDKQLDKTKAKIKKIREKRDKSKELKVSERISEETASYREDNNRLKLEAKTDFKQKHVPAFCNTKLFYALYFPRYFEDIIIIIGALLVTLFIIPCGIYFLMLPQEKVPYLIISYIATVIFFGGIYLLIDNFIKDRFKEEFKQVGELKAQVRANNKNIRVISRRIKKDKDESTYGLENFDEELNRLDKEEADIQEQKKEAILTFDNTTRQVIASEINSLHADKIAALKAELEKTGIEAASADDKIKALTIKMANEYEPFIGKDLMTFDRLDALINIIQAGNASNISEAVAFHRQNQGER